MNLTALYYVTAKRAFPQYRLKERFDTKYPYIDITWIQTSSDFLSPMRHLYSYPEDLYQEDAFEYHKVLVLKFRGVKTKDENSSF